jgi:hypothetical protein
MQGKTKTRFARVSQIVDICEACEGTRHEARGRFGVTPNVPLPCFLNQVFAAYYFIQYGYHLFLAGEDAFQEGTAALLCEPKARSAR